MEKKPLEKSQAIVVINEPGRIPTTIWPANEVHKGGGNWFGMLKK